MVAQEEGVSGGPGGVQALSGLKVLEISGGGIAVAYAGRLLAGFGCQVDVVEPPEGSPLRRLPPYIRVPADEESSAVFLYLAANKRFLTLDVSTPTGRNLLLRLVANADVVLLDDYSLGVGLDLQSLTEANDKALVIVVSPFGSTGKSAQQEATDIVLQAVGGLLYNNGLPDREPVYFPGELPQYIAGVYAAIGALAGLRARRHTQKGQIVELPVALCIPGLMLARLTTYQYTKIDGGRVSPDIRFQGAQKTKDGYIGVNLLTEAQWQAMIYFMGLYELGDDPRFDTPLKRNANQGALAEILAPWWLEHESMEIFERGQEQRIPFGLLMTFDDIVRCKHYRERGFVVDQTLPSGQEVSTLSRPFILRKGGWQERFLTTKKGAHNEEILGRLLNTDRELELLHSSEVI